MSTFGQNNEFDSSLFLSFCLIDTFILDINNSNFNITLLILFTNDTELISKIANRKFFYELFDRILTESIVFTQTPYYKCVLKIIKKFNYFNTKNIDKNKRFKFFDEINIYWI